MGQVLEVGTPWNQTLVEKPDCTIHLQLLNQAILIVACRARLR